MKYIARLIRAVARPRNKAVDLQGIDADAVRKALDGQVRSASGKVPAEAMARILRIRQIILGILPRTGRLPPGAPELFVLERTATDYLPTSLERYLVLPRRYAMLQPVQNGKTPKQLLLEELSLLESKMNDVADAVNRNDASAGKRKEEAGSEQRPGLS
jgi:hypothetical protein